jgi:hypothetical protein
MGIHVRAFADVCVCVYARMNICIICASLSCSVLAQRACIVVRDGDTSSYLQVRSLCMFE